MCAVLGVIALSRLPHDIVYYLGNNGNTLYETGSNGKASVIFENCKGIDITSNKDMSVSYLFVERPDGTKSLFYKSQNKNPILISDNVVSYTVVKGKFKMVYYIAQNENKSLYQYECGKNSMLLSGNNNVRDFSISSDGKYYAFITDTDELYSQSNTKVADNVEKVSVTPYKNTFYYITGDSELFYCSPDTKISDNVSEILGISADCKNIIFKTGENVLYTDKIGSEKQKIDSDFQSLMFFISKDKNDVPIKFDFVYLKDGNAYYKNEKAEKAKLGNMVLFCKYDAADKGFYFIEDGGDVYFSKLSNKTLKDKVKLSEEATALISDDDENVIGYVQDGDLLLLSKGKSGRRLITDVTDNYAVKKDKSIIYFYTDHSQSADTYTLYKLDVKTMKAVKIDTDIDINAFSEIARAGDSTDITAYFKEYSNDTGSMYIYSGKGKPVKITEAFRVYN
jgi:hypothetical protein